MSDNVPFDIQREIIKKVYDVKSLIQFRSVSKPWKSFIDSSNFIKGYGARHTQPHSLILTYQFGDNFKCICLADDDNETFKVQQEIAPSPLLKQSEIEGVGICHGLLCLFCYYETFNQIVVWNPSIRKSFGIALPRFDPQTVNIFGFGVCPVTSDPTVVKVSYSELLSEVNMPWHAEVFTLSSGVWDVIPSSNLLRGSIKIKSFNQVVIDRFIYWGAYENTFDDEYATKHMVVSFDLITKEFKVIDLPHSFTNKLSSPVSVSKLRESLVVYGYSNPVGALHTVVWVMEHDSSFTKLFSIGVAYVAGFTKSGKPICGTQYGLFSTVSKLEVYDPCSQHMKSLGISVKDPLFFMGSYKESLLLLDHSDLHIYSDGI